MTQTGNRRKLDKVNVRRIILATTVIYILFGNAVLSQPATAPATQPQVRNEFLDAGKIIFTAPSELTFLGKRHDDRSASYALGDNAALITMLVTPQQHAIPDEIAPKLAQLVTKTIREEAERGEIDLILPPRAVRDPRFLLRMHDKFNTEERFGDRAHMYRAMGLYLVSVTATAFTEDEEVAKRAHELGAELLLSAQLYRPEARRTGAVTRGPAARPIVLEKARIRVPPPGGWDADANDNASGIIVTFADPADQTNVIAVSVRQLPPEARRDPQLRDILIDEIVAAEKQTFKIDGAELLGETRTITDRRFLRKQRTDYAHEGRRFRITSRQLRAGDVVVSVISMSLDEYADSVDAIADKVALDIRPIGTR